jgi:hypothetical protein
VPRHVARLVTRIVAQLVVDYFAYAARLGASAHRAPHLLSSTTWPTPCDRVPRHVARLITRLVAPLVVDYFASAALRVPRHVVRLVARLVTRLVAPLIVDYSTSRRSSSTTLPRAGSSLNTSHPPRIQVRRHVARLVTRLVAPLVVDYSVSRRLVVDYFASATRPGASARRAARRRLLRLAQARHRLLRLRRATGASARRAASRAARRRLLHVV